MKPVSGGKETFQNLILVPPFVTLAILATPSRSIPAVASVVKSSFEKFETSFSSYSSFDKLQHVDAETYIICFLWCANSKKIEALVFSLNSNDLLENWRLKIHEAFIPNSSVSNTSPSQVQGPLNEVLTQLSTSLHSIQLSWEKVAASKESKEKDSCKFDKLEMFQKHLILNASLKSDLGLAAYPSSELKSLLNCSSLAKAQVLLNHHLNKKRIHIEAQLSFVTALVNIDWIVRGSTNPGKISLLFLGDSSLNGKSSTAEKAALTLRLQELYNKSLSEENIQTLVSSKYASVKDYTELSRLVEASNAFIEILLGDDSAFSLQFNLVNDHVKTEYYYYEMQFQLDPLFGLKFVQKLDRKF